MIKKMELNQLVTSGATAGIEDFKVVGQKKKEEKKGSRSSRED